MARYYVVKERRRGCGCLTVILVILLILVLLAIFALYAFMVTLGIALLISAVVGTVITLKNYIVALSRSIRQYSHQYKPRGSILPTFLYRWIKINWETTKMAWSGNARSIKEYFSKLRNDKPLSFGMWFDLFTVLSIIFFGTMVSIGLFILQFNIILIMLEIFAVIFAVIAVVFIIVGLVMAIIASIGNYIARLKESRRKMARPLPLYILKCGYREYFSILKRYWTENFDMVNDGFKITRLRSLLSVKTWAIVFRSILLIVVGVVLLPVYAVIHIIVLSIMFLVCKIISLITRRY